MLRKELAKSPQPTSYLSRYLDSSARATLGVIEGHPMHTQFGNREEGIALLRQSLDEARNRLLASDMANWELAASVALYRTRLAAMLWDRDPEGAEALYASANRFYTTVIPESPMNLSYRRRAIRMHAARAPVFRGPSCLTR